MTIFNQVNDFLFSVEETGLIDHVFIERDKWTIFKCQVWSPTTLDYTELMLDDNSILLFFKVLFFDRIDIRDYTPMRFDKLL